MITPDDIDPTTSDDWHSDDDEEAPDVIKCPFCLQPTERDPAGRLVFCCKAAAAAWEEA